MATEKLTLIQAIRDHARRIRPLLKNQRTPILLGVLCTFLSIGLTLVYPQVVRLVIDEGVQARDPDRIWFYAMIMMAILAIEAPATYFRYFLFDRAGRRAALELSSRVQRNLLRQEIGFFDRHQAAELNTRALRDAQGVMSLVAHGAQDGLRSLLFAVIGIGLMVYTSPLLAAIVIAVAPLLSLATTLLGRPMQARQSLENRHFAQTTADSQETLSAIRTVRAFDREEHEIERLDTNISTLLKAGDKRVRVTALLEAITALSSEAGLVVGIWAGGLAIVAGYVTVGELISFIFYAQIVVRAFKNIANLGGEIMRIHGATERVYELLEREPRIATGASLRPESATGHIRLEGLEFRYPARPEVQILHGLDLDVPAGQFLAVVGPSGGGKSTVGNLIIRYYEPEAGHIYFDGRDIRELDPAWLREQISLVQQDSSLFSRSIAENTRYGSEDASPEEVDEALRAVAAEEFIARQPEGMETRVGDRGVAFSGGQRQRLTIARALLRRPKVLILDEATSALDSESEAIIKESLQKLDYKPTIIMVAHRLSTVIDADRVVLLQNGEVAADGTHAELLQTSSAYRDLVESQLVSE